MTFQQAQVRVVQPIRLVRRRAQPKAVFVARLTVTAVLSYLVAFLIPGTTSVPTLAPLTALLVLQVSLYKTLHSAVQRIGSVVGGVLIAVGLSSVLGFTWWTLGLAIGMSLTLGLVLRLSEQLLEVPISAMLILSLPTEVNATGRVVETLVGAGVGLLAGLVLSPLQVQPAERSIEELARRMGGLLDRMASGLAEGPDHDEAVTWLRGARALDREIASVDRALAEAEESIRLNPRASRLAHAGAALRSGLEELEHASVTIRGLARSIADLSRRPGEPALEHEDLPATVRHIANAARAYGRMVGADVSGDATSAERALRRDLTAAGRWRDQVEERLRDLPADQGEWTLRGELLVHLDRLLDQLRIEHRHRAREHWPRTRRRRVPAA